MLHGRTLRYVALTALHYPNIFIARRNATVPIVPIVAPFWGLPFGILNIELVKPKPKKRTYNGDDWFLVGAILKMIIFSPY